MRSGAMREVSWERMIQAVEKVRERTRRAVAALENARIPYAIAGGNAVGAWVSRVDEAAVRMKLTSFRDKDRTHLRDLIEVGLIDQSWLARIPLGLQPRL